MPHRWRRFGKVKPLPLRKPLNDVNEDHIGETGLGDTLCGGGANIPCADDGDLTSLNPCHVPSALLSAAR
jgi:hypothetical protein